MFFVQCTGCHHAPKSGQILLSIIWLLQLRQNPFLPAQYLSPSAYLSENVHLFREITALSIQYILLTKYAVLSHRFQLAEHPLNKNRKVHLLVNWCYMLSGFVFTVRGSYFSSLFCIFFHFSLMGWGFLHHISPSSSSRVPQECDKVSPQSYCGFRAYTWPQKKMVADSNTME